MTACVVYHAAGCWHHNPKTLTQAHGRDYHNGRAAGQFSYLVFHGAHGYGKMDMSLVSQNVKDQAMPWLGNCLTCTWSWEASLPCNVSDAHIAA